MPFLLSLLMTCVVSMISTLKSLGFSNFTLPDWIGAWVISWLIAFPVLLLALPIVKKLTLMLVEPPH
ncbi:DUF2798 domain-containing protein [Acinetobacter populi]|uniref:DUF2798 domain-containing protein n=2 Tax=Acinetobacter populi TaxID=1582270 RepID=A0A1Z9YU51_9GAMM|nr:DUF2798 domain-containing protein [Acinetobacter populi]OUY05752.1 hypothetical protein CAP51_16150 [Acinetobacter populi]